METSTDIRWQQRLSNYLKALAQLGSAVEQSKIRALSELEQQGLIKAFEFTYELAWNVMRDYLTYLGITGLMGSRDTFREAFNKGPVTDGHVWMEMIKSRNQSSHTYDEATADKIVADTVQLYFPQFETLAQTFTSIRETKNV